jgi:DNA-binding NarL/FixJ family response regulator
MKKIRILLIEDNRLLREGMAITLDGQPDFRVVATSGGNHNPLLQTRRTKPDVILIDLGLRNQNNGAYPFTV